MTAEPPWIGPNPAARSLLTKDPPDHARLNALVSRAFGVSGMARIETRVREVSARLAAAAVERGEVDLVESFTHAARRHAPRQDVVSELLQAKLEGRALADEEILSFLFLLLPAGMDTTTHALGNLLLTLLRRPDQWEQVRADPAHIPCFIEEVLRHEPPTPLSFRLATRDVELGGTHVPAGSLVMGLIASTNRDERVFERPEQFFPGRPNASQHLTFGHGIHFCLGAQLARTELRLALEAFVSRVRAFMPRFTPVQWLPLLASHGLEALPVELISD